MAGQLQVLRQGKRGRILTYVRSNGRCPAFAFLERTSKHLRSRYDRAFAEFCRDGLSMVRVTLFKPLQHEGKGVWAWKEHDHRLFSFRGPDWNGRTQMVLLGGWVKDKDASIAGSVEERREVSKAQALKVECEHEVDWGKVIVLGGPLLPTAATAVVPVEAAAKAETTEVREAMVTVLEPEKAAVTPEHAAVEAPLASMEDQPPQLRVVPEQMVVEAAKEKTFGVTELADLTGATVEWLQAVVDRGDLSCGVRRNDQWVWRWDDADEVVVQVERLQGKEPSMAKKYDCSKCGKKFSTRTGLVSHGTVHEGQQTAQKPDESPFACPHCDKTFGKWESLRGHMSAHSGERGLPSRKVVTLARLAKRLGVSTGRINSLRTRGWIPDGIKDGGRRFWEPVEAREIQVHHAAFMERFRENRIGFRRTEDGVFVCPECKAVFTAPAPLVSHFQACQVMWDKAVSAGVTERPEPDPQPVPQTSCRHAEALDVLRKGGRTMSSEEIAEQTGMSLRMVWTRMNTLQKLAYVQETASGRKEAGRKEVLAAIAHLGCIGIPQPGDQEAGIVEKGAETASLPTPRETPAGTKTVTPLKLSPIPTKAELLQLAERVIDNAADPQEFVRLVRVHIEGITRMEQELQRIKGGK